MRKIWLAITSIILAVSLTGCNLLENEYGKMVEAFKGREVVIQTYDEESNVIDRVEGKSVSVSSDGQFDLTDAEGNTVEKSSVLSFTVGGHSMLHVGSSLIMHEKGLDNVFEDYTKTIDIKNQDRSIPFINRLVDSYKNITTGKDKVVLIRSQSGQPLATFIGENVSYFSTDVDKSTGLLIDGKYLFIYRCDYTIYDTELLK